MMPKKTKTAGKKSSKKTTTSTGFVGGGMLQYFKKPSRILIAVLSFANVGVALLLFASATAPLVADYEPTHAIYVNNWRTSNGKIGRAHV